MEPRTDHSQHIQSLRIRGTLEDRLAADLLELHDDRGLSLNLWPSAREFVEQRIGGPITENRA